MTPCCMKRNPGARVQRRQTSKQGFCSRLDESAMEPGVANRKGMQVK